MTDEDHSYAKRIEAARTCLGSSLSDYGVNTIHHLIKLEIERALDEHSKKQQ